MTKYERVVYSLFGEYKPIATDAEEIKIHPK